MPADLDASVLLVLVLALVVAAALALALVLVLAAARRTASPGTLIFATLMPKTCSISSLEITRRSIFPVASKRR